MRNVLTLAAALLCLTWPAQAQDDPVAAAVIDYMDFATETQGVILPQQIDREAFEAATFIDTRPAAQYDEAHIPGAIHIEWREVPARLDELPETGLVILYCNTGARSAQATFAARLLGRDNVVVLQSGFEGWQADAAYRPQ
jgi:rhodanese-related sulfurtransferase